MNRVRREQLEYLGPRSFFTGENSFFVESFDPLVQGDTRETDVLLDRFIKYRAAAGRPMTRREFADAFRYTNAMGGYGPKVAESITARARRHLEARP